MQNSLASTRLALGIALAPSVVCTDLAIPKSSYAAPRQYDLLLTQAYYVVPPVPGESGPYRRWITPDGTITGPIPESANGGG